MKMSRCMVVVIMFATLLSACGGATAPTNTPAPKSKLAVVMPQGTENDKGFNQSTLEGARRGAEAGGVEFKYVTSQAVTDYEKNIEALVADGTKLIIALGFLTGDAIAEGARRHPEVRFLTDTVYAPGFGCAPTAKDCYTDGGLSNVTSLAFAEDEVGYLAGVLGGCMTKSGKVATVAGIEIPPVVRFVQGFENGAKSVRPDVEAMHQYIPDFNDRDTGKVVGQGFITDGADVMFVAAGETGNGALQAASEAGIMAIGVDVDQFLTYPEVGPVLMSSAQKKVDVAINDAVKDWAAGKLNSGIRPANVANGGVGLAPYHDWESKISDDCKGKVKAAESAIKADPKVTGAK